IVKTMFNGAIGGDAKIISRALNDAVLYLGRSMWTSMLPSWMTPGHRRFEQALGTLNALIYRFIDERRRAEDDPGDFLTMLLQVRDVDTGEGMSDKQVR